MAPHATRARPAWREPMLWLVFGIPAASVVASVALLVAAARSSGTHDAVADRVQRTAQIQVADLAPDLAARRLDLAAMLHMEGDELVLVPTRGDFPRNAVLQLWLRHPARAGADVALQLQPAADGWRTRHAMPATHDWNLELAPPDRAWRLQGRLVQGQRHAALQPALDAP